MIPCRIHGYAVFGYFYGVRTAFVAEELIGKVTGIRYTPLLKPSDSGLVMRECADVPKKHNLIVFEAEPEQLSFPVMAQNKLHAFIIQKEIL